MATRLAWVLNLDSDLELEKGPSYVPRRRTIDAMRTHARSLADTLLDPDDLIVDAESPCGIAKGLAGRAFCPTPNAQVVLQRAEAIPERHPAVAILRTVNSRAFCEKLGSTLPNSAFVRDVAPALRMLAGSPEIGVAWRVKRAFGMAGRGQRIVTPNETCIAFVGRWIAEGGVQIEPNVELVREYAMHALLDDSSTLDIGNLVEQRCDQRGAWLKSEQVRDPSVISAIGSRLTEELHRVAAELRIAGYFGPFGIDAFTYRGPQERVVLRPRSEINARYSMGFGVGFRRPRSQRLTWA